MSGVYIGRVGLCGPLAFIPKTRDARVKGSIDTLEVWPGRSKELRRSRLHIAFRNNLETAKTPRCLAMLHWRSEADTRVTRYGRLRLGPGLGFCRRTRCAVDRQQNKNPSLRVDPASARRAVSLEPWLFHGPRSFSSDPRRHEGARKDRRL